jgi:hypothetical protein
VEDNDELALPRHLEMGAVDTGPSDRGTTVQLEYPADEPNEIEFYRLVSLATRVACQVVPKWRRVLSKGSFGDLDLNTTFGELSFNELFQASVNGIIRRECRDCNATHQEIFYARLGDHTSFNPYDYMKSEFREENNVFGVDFNVFSTYEDALSGENAWAACPFDPLALSLGFPGACGLMGPSSADPQTSNWESSIWEEDPFPDVAFYVENNGEQPMVLDGYASLDRNNEQPVLLCTLPPAEVGLVTINFRVDELDWVPADRDFFYHAPYSPVLLDVDPTSGPVSGTANTTTNITLTGQNLDATGQLFIRIGESVTHAQFEAEGVVTVVVPANGVAQAAAISLSYNGGNWVETDFAFFYTPVITSMLPDSGPVTGGTMLTLEGEGLNAEHRVITCRFGEFGGTTIAHFDAGRVMCSTPPQTDLGQPEMTVSVATDLSEYFSSGSDSMIFTYVPPVQISEINPAAVPLLGSTTMQLTLSGAELTGQYGLSDSLQNVSVGLIPFYSATGATSATAAKSCAHILAAHPDASTGQYWIAPDSTIEPFQALCDMTTDGGGWLVLALNGSSTGVVAMQTSEYDTWTKCDDDAAAAYGLSEAYASDVDQVASAATARLYYANPETAEVYSALQMETIRSSAKELNGNTRTVVTTTGDSNVSVTVHGAGGVEEVVALAPGSGDMCGDYAHCQHDRVLLSLPDATDGGVPSAMPSVDGRESYENFWEVQGQREQQIIYQFGAGAPGRSVVDEIELVSGTPVRSGTLVDFSVLYTNDAEVGNSSSWQVLEPMHDLDAPERACVESDACGGCVNFHESAGCRDLQHAIDEPESCAASMDCNYVPGDSTAPCPTECTFVSALAPIAASAETCVDTVEGEVVADCATGYEAGDAQNPSESCPSGCTLTPAVAAICSGLSDDGGLPCALATDDLDCAVPTGDCHFEPGSGETCIDTVEGEAVADCATGYEPGDAQNPSESCPSGCTLTPAVDEVIARDEICAAPDTEVCASADITGHAGRSRTSCEAAGACSYVGLADACEWNDAAGFCASVLDESTPCFVTQPRCEENNPTPTVVVDGNRVTNNYERRIRLGFSPLTATGIRIDLIAVEPVMLTEVVVRGLEIACVEDLCLGVVCNAQSQCDRTTGRCIGSETDASRTSVYLWHTSYRGTEVRGRSSAKPSHMPLLPMDSLLPNSVTAVASAGGASFGWESNRILVRTTLSPALELPAVVGPGGIIHCIVPAGQTALPDDAYAEVSFNGVQYSQSRRRVSFFDPEQLPEVVDVAPGAGPKEGGTALTLTGSNFADQPSLQCRFESAQNTQIVAAVFETSTMVQCQTPRNAIDGGDNTVAGVVQVRVTNNGTDFSDSSVAFTYTATSAAYCSADGPGFQNELSAEEVGIVTIVARTAGGERRTSGGDVFYLDVEQNCGGSSSSACHTSAAGEVIPFQEAGVAVVDLDENIGVDISTLLTGSSSESALTMAEMEEASLTMSAEGGTYAGIWKTTVSGDYSVHISSGGVQISGSPFTITVAPLATDVATSTLSGFFTTAEVGVNQMLLLQPKDRYGNTVTSSTINAVVGEVCTDWSQSGECTEWTATAGPSVVDQIDGRRRTIQVAYEICAESTQGFADPTPPCEAIEGRPSPVSVLVNSVAVNGAVPITVGTDTSGQYLLEASLGGSELPESGVRVAFFPSQTHGPSSIVVSDLHAFGAGTDTARFMFSTRDRYGNSREVGGDTFNILVTCVGTNEEIAATVDDLANSSYVVQFSPTVSGAYEIVARVATTRSYSQGDTVINVGAAEDSRLEGRTLHSTVLPAPLHVPSCRLSGPGKLGSTAGVLGLVDIQGRDQYSNNRTTDDGEFSFNLHASSDVRRSFRGQNVDVSGVANYTGLGQYRIAYAATLTGSYEISIMNGCPGKPFAVLERTTLSSHCSAIRS